MGYRRANWTALYNYPSKARDREIIIETPLGDEVHIPCLYCGEPYDHEDHALPISFIAKLDSIDSLTQSQKNMLLVVPACAECNNIASDRIDETMTLRIERVKAGLRRKHRHLLTRPNWQPDEIAELGPDLAAHVRANAKAADRLRERLRW